MGIVTHSQFRNDLLNALGRDVEAEKLTRWLNQSMQEFGYAFKFHCLEATGQFTTVQGQESYDPPADFRVMHDSGMEVISPADCLGRLLSETRVHWRLHRDTSGTLGYCPPTHYHVYANKFILRPIPGDGYIIDFDYWLKLKSFAADDDVSPFNEDWDDIIFTGALYRGQRAYGEYDRYKNVRNDFIGMIRSRVAEEDLEEFPVGGISQEQSPYDEVIR